MKIGSTVTKVMLQKRNNIDNPQKIKAKHISQQQLVKDLFLNSTQFLTLIVQHHTFKINFYVNISDGIKFCCFSSLFCYLRYDKSCLTYMGSIVEFAWG